jgi:ABC-type lipoprotein export system ATPase subunit
MNSQDTANGAIVRTEDLSRIYHVGGRELQALKNVNLELHPGKVVALRGRSGSGKTTLLNCIAGLDQPTSGHVWFQDRDITQFSERELVKLRRNKVGFVFQSHALLMTYSARENVDLLLRLSGMGRRDRRQRVREVLNVVGLEKWIDHRPFELSGGQQQRVAIARAIAARPPLILADEPTGELDTTTGRHILELFREIANYEGTTILIATHDLAVDALADEVYQLEDGRLVEEKVLLDSR